MHSKKWAFLGIIIFLFLIVSMIIYLILPSSRSQPQATALATLKIAKVKDDPSNKRHAITISYINTSSKQLKSLSIGISIEGGTKDKDYKVTGVYKGIPTQGHKGLPENQYLYKVDDLKPGKTEWIEIYINKNTPNTLKITGFLTQIGKGYSTISKTATVELSGE
jgi:hypothetical protein